MNEGETGTYTVVLDSAPAGNVTVTPSSDDPGAAAVSGALTFTASTWNSPQSVTVTGVEENDGDGHDETATVSHAVGGYGSVTSAPDVEVAVQDNDVQANGIYALSDEARVGNDIDLDYNGVVLHDGRIMGISFEQDSFAYSDFSGTYTADGDRLSGQVRGTERTIDGASFTLAIIHRFESRQFSGTVVEAESAQLTLTDADGGEDRFSLHYDNVYDRPSSLPLWEGTWVVVRDGLSIDTMTVAPDGGFFRQHVSGCAGNGRLSILDPDRNLYELRDDVANCGTRDGAYTGFAYLDPPDGSDNDRAVLMAMQDNGPVFLDTTFSRPGAIPSGADPEDDHGNARDSATAVGVPSDTGGVLTEDDVDYFSISLSDAGTLLVYTSGSIGTLGILEHADGSEIAADDDSGEDRNFRIERALASGLYFVRVIGNPSNTTGDYTLHVRLAEE